MNTKAAALIGLMEALASTSPVRNDIMGLYSPEQPRKASRKRDDRKTKGRRKQAAKSRKINRGRK